MKLRIIIVSAIMVLLPSLVSLQSQDNQASAQQYNPLEFADRILNSGAVASLNPVSLATRFNKYPFEIFDFVRDSIRFEAYPGSLRGARGTLIAGAGNSYDQAILLKAALDAADIETKLLRGRLPRHLATELIENMTSIAPRFDTLEGTLESIACDISKSVRAGIAEAHDSAVKGLIDKALKAANQDAAALQLTPSDGDIGEIIDQTIDYLWVRMTIGERQYDLHPAFPEGRKVDVEELGVMEYVTSMPMELHHWVRLRLFAERIVEDGLQRFLVLDNRVLPAAVVGQRVSICLRPEQSGDKVILRPVLRAGDLSFSGEELSVQSSDGSPVGGSLTSLWLEISVLSPFQRPRTETITLADAFPASPDWRTRDEKSLEKTKTLPDRALNVQVDLIVVSGWLSPAVCLERSALALRRIFAASDILPLSAEAVEAIRTTNPILLQWAYTLCTALSGDDSTARAYIDSPAIALVVYLPHGGESKGQVKVMTGLPHFSAVFINESRQPAGLPGMFASRLLQEWAKQSAPVTLDQLLFAGSSIAYKKCEAGDASTLCERGWDWSSINELEFDQLRRSMVFCPDSGKEIVWWRLKGDRSQPLLRGPGGWITLWYSDVLPQRINKSLAQETETSIVVKRDKRQLRELLEEQLGSSDVSPFTATARSLFAEDLLDAILTESVE